MRRPLLALALAAFLALVVASVFLFILYDDDPVGKADAIVVLAGSKHRLPVGLRLFERCYGGGLAFVGAPSPWWQRPLAVASEWLKLSVAEARRAC